MTAQRLWRRSHFLRTHGGSCPNWCAKWSPAAGANCGRGWQASVFPMWGIGGTERRGGRTAPERRTQKVPWTTKH